MRKLLIAAGLMISLPAYAGWFGPANYDECVLDTMKGQREYMMSSAESACRTRFPYTQKELDYLSAIEEQRKIQFSKLPKCGANQFSGNYFACDPYP
jgi:hypothetical protein